MPYIISTFDTWTSVDPTQNACQVFKDVVALAAHAHLAAPGDKRQTPAFSPVSYKPGTTRGNKNVDDVYLYVADYDSISQSDLLQVLDFLVKAELQYAVYSSYSHGATPDKYSFRVVVPLSAPVPAARWSAYVWAAITARLPVTPDAACKDPARLFGMPYTPNPQQAFREVCLEGKVLEVPEVPKALPNYAFGTPERPLLTRSVWDADEALKKWVKTLSQYSGDEDKGWQYAVISALCRGKPIADVAMGRHDTMLRVTALLERRFPFVTLDALASVFEPSLVAMAQEDPRLNVEARTQDILRALEGARAHRVAQRANEIDAKDAAVRNVILARAEDPAVRAAPDVRQYNDPTPYTDEELLHIARAQGYPGAPEARLDIMAYLRKRWLLVRKSTYYILTHAGYTTGIASNDLEAELYRLEPAVSAGVELLQRTANGGVKQKTTKNLQQDYGRAVDEVVLSYLTSTAHLQISGPGEGRATLHLSAGKLRGDLQPVYDANVARWLAALAGPQHDKVLDWLACVPRLEEPLAALYISGPSGVGKNLLSLSLAKMFHAGGPVDLGTVLGAGRFNEALIRCPIVLADEAMPSEATFENVCEFIGTTSRAMKEKYVAQATLLGAARLILTANKDTMMSFVHHTRRSYTRDQFDAVARRVLHVAVQPEAGVAELLRTTMPEHYKWTENETIAKHVLWLAQNRKVERQPGARFLVEGNFSRMLDKFVDTNPLLSRIVEWLARYLTNPTPVEAGPMKNKIRIQGDAVVLTPATLHSAWKSYADTESRAERPTAEMFATALDTLRDDGGLPGVPLRHILRWVERTGFAPAATYNKYLCAPPGAGRTVADLYGIEKRSTN